MLYRNFVFGSKLRTNQCAKVRRVSLCPNAFSYVFANHGIVAPFYKSGLFSI